MLVDFTAEVADARSVGVEICLYRDQTELGESVEGRLDGILQT